MSTETPVESVESKMYTTNTTVLRMDLILRVNVKGEWCDYSVFSESVPYLRQEMLFVFPEVVTVGSTSALWFSIFWKIKVI